MNLLIFTLSLILILAAMSYARFENFTKNRFQANMWMAILKDSQRDLYNQQQKLKIAKPPTKKNNNTPTPNPRDERKNKPAPNRAEAGSGSLGS